MTLLKENLCTICNLRFKCFNHDLKHLSLLSVTTKHPFKEQINYDPAEMRYKLSLIDSIYNSSFCKTIKGCSFTNNTIQSVEFAHIQISSAILSVLKQTIHLPHLTDLYSIISFQDLLILLTTSHYLYDISFFYHNALRILLCIFFSKYNTFSSKAIKYTGSRMASVSYCFYWASEPHFDHQKKKLIITITASDY